MSRIQIEDAIGQAGPSPTIWGQVDFAVCQADPNKGVAFRDHFLCFGGTVTTNVGTKGGTSGIYKTFEDTSCTIEQINDIGGWIKLLTNASDNNEVSMEAGYGLGGSWKAKAAAGGYRLGFEARIRPTTLAAAGSEGNFFIGLAEKGLAVTDGLFSDADAIGDKSLIGFRCLKADAYTLKAVHQKNGGGGEQAIALSTTTKLTAGTIVKLGILFDRKNTGKVCRWFVDGVEVASISDATVAKFPNDVLLTPYACLKNGAAAAQQIDADWWQIAMPYV